MRNIILFMQHDRSRWTNHQLCVNFGPTTSVSSTLLVFIYRQQLQQRFLRVTDNVCLNILFKAAVNEKSFSRGTIKQSSSRIKPLVVEWQMWKKSGFQELLDIFKKSLSDSLQKKTMRQTNQIFEQSLSRKLPKRPVDSNSLEGLHQHQTGCMLTCLALQLHWRLTFFHILHFSRHFCSKQLTVLKKGVNIISSNPFGISGHLESAWSQFMFLFQLFVYFKTTPQLELSFLAGLFL